VACSWGASFASRLSCALAGFSSLGPSDMSWSSLTSVGLVSSCTFCSGADFSCSDSL